MTPTKEQIEAEINPTVDIFFGSIKPLSAGSFRVLQRRMAYALATARLQGEAKGREKALAAAAERIKDRFAGQVPRWIAEDILALKERPDDTR